ncbi:unnamed protein product, partial [Prorocentrum cordatum]
MPNAHWQPKVMVIHTALACQCAQRFAGRTPLIFAGDWNFKPGSAPYQLVTTGNLPEDHPDHPGYPKDEPWRIEDGLRPMRSAYAEANPGGEPEFTNYAWVRNDIDPFIGTLDYIFVSRASKVTGVGKLPRVQSCGSPLPTAKEPSDHLLLSARVLPHGQPRERPEDLEKQRPRGLSRLGVSRHSKYGVVDDDTDDIDETDDEASPAAKPGKVGMGLSRPPGAGASFGGGRRLSKPPVLRKLSSATALRE